MKPFLPVVVLLIGVKYTCSFPQSGPDPGDSRRRRDAPCREYTEYLNNNICCPTCPAGTHVKSHCTRAGEAGKCEDCDYGTQTEHPNGLEQCFKCTQCRSDQEIVRPCTQTQNTECQCKVGRFCATDEACEVCKKCSRCKKDEEIVRNCTSTSDTVCKEIQSASPSASDTSSVILGLVVPCVFVVAVIVWWSIRRGCRRNPPDGHKTEERSSVERRNGQSRGLSCSNLIPSRQPDDEPFPKLIPVNGEESLRKCFEYFEEIDVDYHKRFFRHLGINDNVIKSKEHLTYEDRIHDLLNIWVEKKGRDASLNDLLKALLVLNQRRTAENVKQNVIEYGHYTCEKEFSELCSENM